MQPLRHLRLLAIAGLATAVAATAHGGGDVLADPGYAGVAFAGALATLTAVAAAWRRLAGGGPVPAALPLPMTAAALVVAELGAHLALTTAGAHAAAGPLGSPALHVVLGLLAALLLRSLELGAARVAPCGLPAVPAPSLPRPPRRIAPTPQRPRLGRYGRAPPCTA
jgi:hypothetical protein